MSDVPPSEEVMMGSIVGGVTADVVKTLALGMVIAGADEDVAVRLAGMHIAKIQAGAWDEGRESVAADMMKPLDESGVRQASPNPYRAT